MPMPPPAVDQGAHDERLQGLPRFERFMWLSADRLLYAGLLGAPTLRTLGSHTLYVAHEGQIHLRLGGSGDWCHGELALVPPYVPHQVLADSRLINVLQVEAETVDPQALPPLLRGPGGVLQDDGFVQHVRQQRERLRGTSAAGEPTREGFDRLFFGAALVPRRIDPRIQAVVDLMRSDPAAPLAAEDCARAAGLSFSRFLHLFKQEVGAPFRSVRTWKRARSLLHHVRRDANLLHVALDTGYPDSTHFSHSIRQVYGLKPKDIFAGSRRLAVYGA